MGMPSVRLQAAVTRALRAVVLGGAAFGAATAAAEPATPSSTAGRETLDEVVVVGSRPIAESEEAALEMQREFPSLVSIVSADAVGRLPDQNIAFAVGRLPGIGVQRDQGQARYVNLRGAPTDWTTLSFDGINVVSPEGRASRFDNVPSALAAQIQARKAVTPDMPGETLAGNVNIVTRDPFDYDGFDANLKAGYGYVDLGDGREIDASAVVSDTFAGGTLGWLASASYYEREMATDNIETDWEPVNRVAGLPGAADRPLWGREHENKLYRLTRYNYSGSFRFGWQPSDDTRVFFNSIYTQYRDDELRSNIKWDLDDRENDTPNSACASRPNGGTTVSGPASGYADICTGNTPLRGTIYGIDFDNNFNDLESIEYTWSNTLGGDHTLGDWGVDWRLNYAKVKDGTRAPALTDYDSTSARATRPSVVYDFTDPNKQRIEVYRTVVGAGNTYSLGQRVLAVEDFAWPLTQLRRRWGGAEGDAVTAKLDALREVDLFGATTEVKVGALYAERNKFLQETVYSIQGGALATAGLPTTFAAIANDDGYLGDLDLGYTFRYHDSDRARALLDQAIASGQGSFTTTRPYDVTETIYAGYAMGTTRFDWGNVVYGARIERTRNEGEAPFAAPASPGVPAVTGIARSERSDTLVFPSAHLNWDLNPDMKLRLSVNTGAARPDYDQLAPSLSVDDVNDTASGGNPGATPEKAWGVDAYYEWYLQPRGILSAGVYYKKVTDVLFNGLTRLGPVSFPDPVDRSDYVLSTVVNGGDGEIYGLELAYQQPAELLVEKLGWPAWLGGFGLQANVTLTDSEAETPSGRIVQLPGTSDAVYNAIVYYENYGFSARVSYQFRTDWLSGVSENGIASSNGGDTFWRQDGELDFSMRYTFREGLEWFFDASNLTDGPGRRFVTDPIYTIEYERFGRRFMTGVRVGL